MTIVKEATRLSAYCLLSRFCLFGFNIFYIFFYFQRLNWNVIERYGREFSTYCQKMSLYLPMSTHNCSRFFRKRAQNTKIGKTWTSRFLSAHKGETPFGYFHKTVSKQSDFVKKYQKLFTSGTERIAISRGHSPIEKPVYFLFRKKRVRLSTLQKNKTLATRATCASICQYFGASTTKNFILAKNDEDKSTTTTNFFCLSSLTRRLRGNLPRSRIRRGFAHTPTRAISRQ